MPASPIVLCALLAAANPSRFLDPEDGAFSLAWPSERPLTLGAIELPPAENAQETSADAPPDAEERSKFISPEDGWFDVSAFLDEKYGFLPIVVPITEPAVGYGAAVGLLFLSQPLGAMKSEYDRPNITALAGLGTDNGTWGVAAGDVRHWFDGRLQTVAGILHASVNLDFHGVGQDNALDDDPLHYELEPTGGFLQGKLRLGESRFFGGLSFAYFSTQVSFDEPAGAAGLPNFDRTSHVGGLTPSLTYDTRDNIFTPLRGTYVEASAGFFDPAFGADDAFQRAQILAMQFFPLAPDFSLGLRGQVTAVFGDEPFYLAPYVAMRGVPVLRYQGEEVAQIEAELRWQFWKRVSAVGFVGQGYAWNDFERVDDTQSVLAGGFGLRYELAREYGIHAGLDVAFGPDTTAIYIQVGSAWARP